APIRLAVKLFSDWANCEAIHPGPRMPQFSAGAEDGWGSEDSGKASGTSGSDGQARSDGCFHPKRRTAMAEEVLGCNRSAGNGLGLAVRFPDRRNPFTGE